MLEETARMIYEAETGRLWKDATEEERRHWLREAQHLIDAIHAPASSWSSPYAFRDHR